MRCGSDYNGLSTIKLGGWFWDHMLTKWDRTYHYNFIILFNKLESEEVFTWLRIFSPFPWKITYVWSPQILFEKHTKKEYVLVKHEGRLLVSWALSYSWQFYVVHNHQWTYDLTFVSNANSKSRFCWLVCFANEWVCLEIEKYFFNAWTNLWWSKE